MDRITKIHLVGVLLIFLSVVFVLAGMVTQDALAGDVVSLVFLSVFTAMATIIGGMIAAIVAHKEP